MKKLFWSLSIFSLLMLNFSSCNSGECATKQKFIETFDSFVEEAANDAKNQSKKERLVFEDKYKDLVNNCYKKFREDLTLEERQDFWKKSVKFYFNGNINSFELNIGSENDEKFNTYVEEEIESVLKESGSDFAELVGDLLKDKLGPALDELFKGIGNFTEELSKSLE